MREKTIVRDLIFKYNRVQFVWSDDNRKCKAVFFNDDCTADMESVDCRIVVGERDMDNNLVHVSAFLEYQKKGMWHEVNSRFVYDPDHKLDPCIV